MSFSFEDVSRANASHYARLLRKHGDGPEAAQWSDQASQDRRLEILCAVDDLKSAKVLDFGCGTGRLLTFLRARGFAGEYIGYDVAAEVVAAAQKKHVNARFECRDIFSAEVPEEFDYVIISGVFNNRHVRAQEFMRGALAKLFAHTRKGLAFNALSTHVDYFDDDLYYANPEEEFGFCKKNLSPCVTLRHDYQLKAGIIPYEFTMYVYRFAGAARSAEAASLDKS